MAVLAACSPRPARQPDTEPPDFLASRLTAWRDGLAVITDPRYRRSACYDAALVALCLLRRGRPREAASVLLALRGLQRDGGAIPFSVLLDDPEETREYVRSGAVAWVGYAAAEFLDAGVAHASRDRVLELAHHAASYLLARVVDASSESDPRGGLVTGGDGVYVYEVDRSGALRERLVGGPVRWASVEHNVDTFFFLRRLARVTGSERYASAAGRIRDALLASAFRDAQGQFVAGLNPGGTDENLTLDCASWGSLFLSGVGEAARARLAARTSDARYASVEPRSGARGHRPYARGPVYENVMLMRRYGPALPARDWERLDAVWPEGSAGVAMAALRVGNRGRAAQILDELEPLRDPLGALPTFTVDVPMLFDTAPSVAGTAWVELVRYELARPEARPTLWVG